MTTTQTAWVRFRNNPKIFYPTLIFVILLTSLCCVVSVKTISWIADKSHIYIAQGDALYDQGNFEKAISDFDKVVQLDPELPDAYFSRGIASANLGDFENAKVDCNKTIQLYPEFAHAYKSRGLAFQEIEDYPAALADLRRYLELSPDSEDREWVEQQISGLESQIP